MNNPAKQKKKYQIRKNNIRTCSTYKLILHVVILQNLQAVYNNIMCASARIRRHRTIKRFILFVILCILLLISINFFGDNLCRSSLRICSLPSVADGNFSIIIYVKSFPEDATTRAAIRKTWAKEARKLGIGVLFVVGTTNGKTQS